MGAETYDSGLVLEQGLGPERAAEVKHRLTMGHSAASVAKLIHKEWEAFPDKSYGTVEAMVYRYRRSITGQQLVRQIKKVMGKKSHFKAFDAMGTLEEVIKLQRKRVQKALDMEDKTQLLMSSTGQELRLLKDMCGDMAKLQLETGVLQRAPKTITGAMRDAQGNTTNFTWTESDEQLLDSLETGAVIEHESA